MHSTLSLSFRRLSRKLGLRGISDRAGPRLHDLRHTMAVEVLRQSYCAGADPERRLPALSTYLGHTHLKYTYWYLHQNPSLMKQAVTPFLRAARERGCETQVGTDMLFEQIPAYLEFFGFPTTTADNLRKVAQIEY